MAHPPPKAVTRIHSAATGPSHSPTQAQLRAEFEARFGDDPPARPTHHVRPVIEVIDQVSEVRDAFLAFEALENLVTSYSIDKTDALDLPRSQLASLLRNMNQRLRDELGKLKTLANAAGDAVRGAV